MSQLPQFRNLVFEGGGVKGAAYLGALQVLEERGMLAGVQRVAGASAGAITAMITSFKLDSAEITKLVNSLDFSRIPQKRSSDDPGWWKELPKGVRELLEGVFGDLDCVYRLVHSYGWYATEYFYEWLQGVVKERVGDPMATFADFRTKRLLDLHVVSSDISTWTARIFCADETPAVPVADAVRMSMSIPLFFQSLPFDGRAFGSGDWYADGGTVLNYPLDVFDDPRYEGDTPLLSGGRNPETLGFHLCTPDRCPPKRKPVTNLVTYVENLFESLLQAQEILLLNNSEDLRRTVNINNCCVMATDFHIQPGDATYKALVQSGIAAMTRYLDRYPDVDGACVEAT